MGFCESHGSHEKGHHWEIGLWVIFCIFHSPSYFFLVFLFVYIFKNWKRNKTPQWNPCLCVPGASLDDGKGGLLVLRES